MKTRSRKSKYSKSIWNWEHIFNSISISLAFQLMHKISTWIIRDIQTISNAVSSVVKISEVKKKGKEPSFGSNILKQLWRKQSTRSKPSIAIWWALNFFDILYLFITPDWLIIIIKRDEAKQIEI